MLQVPSGQGNTLDLAIAKIGDDALRIRIAREVDLLRGSRRFGLVFDRHLPEFVRLPSHPVRKGVQVGLKDESSRETWKVTRFTDNTRSIAVLDDSTEIDTAELVVVREFGEPVYPGLRAGAVEESRIVSIVKQKRRRRKLNLIGQAWNWLLYLTVGYGYRTWWAGLWLLGLLTIGSVIFAQAYPKNMVPTAGAVPAFQPVAYTIDVLVPFVDLGQKKAWVPKGTAMIWSWMLTGWGWVLTTAVVAGLTNALKRD